MIGQCVVFRADANHVIGSGHVSRCAKLAKRLTQLGAKVAFVSFGEGGHNSAIADGIPLIQITEPRTPCGVHRVDISRQSSDELTDAERTIRAFPTKPDWVVVDSYDLASTWESAVRPHCGRLAVLDDLGRTHDCDLLIDPNWYGEETHSRYEGRLQPGTIELIGPDFAFVDPLFREYRVSPIDRHRPVRRALVYFGGSDTYGLSDVALEALSLPEFRALEVAVVCGATAAKKESLDDRAARHPRARFHGHQPSLAPLLADAELAIELEGLGHDLVDRDVLQRDREPPEFRTLEIGRAHV